MSTKPSIVPDWTPSGADVATPSAGEKTNGWQGGARPPAQKFNWFWKHVSLWCEYLSDGVFEDISLVANDHITLSGTGIYKHGARETSFPGRDGNGLSATFGTSGDQQKIFTTSGGLTLHPITGLPAGARILSIDITNFKSSGSNQAVYTLHQYIGSTDTESDHGNVTGTATGPPATDTIASINKVLVADAAYYVSCAAGSTSVQGTSLITVHYDQP